METTPKAMEIEYIRIKRLNQGREKAYATGMNVICCYYGSRKIEPGEIKEKGRLQPGKILMIDTEQGKIYYDGELKEQLASARPYRAWLSANRIELDTLKSGRKIDNRIDGYDRMLRTFGFSREDIERTLMPMCNTGAEPIASMGNDTPLAVLSDRPQLLFNYFRQQFAQVTNPAIDPIREELVMSLTEYIGAVGMNILVPSESHCKMVRLPHPVLNNTQLDILCNIRYKGFNTVKLPIVFEVSKGKAGLQEALNDLCKQAEQSVTDGVNYIILSDRFVDDTHAAIPSLLAVYHLCWCVWFDHRTGDSIFLQWCFRCKCFFWWNITYHYCRCCT